MWDHIELGLLIGGDARGAALQSPPAQKMA